MGLRGCALSGLGIYRRQFPQGVALGFRIAAPSGAPDLPRGETLRDVSPLHA